MSRTRQDLAPEAAAILAARVGELAAAKDGYLRALLMARRTGASWRALADATGHSARTVRGHVAKAEQLAAGAAPLLPVLAMAGWWASPPPAPALPRWDERKTVAVALAAGGITKCGPMLTYLLARMDAHDGAVTVSAAELGEVLQVKPATAKRYLRLLRLAGLIEPTTTTNDGCTPTRRRGPRLRAADPDPSGDDRPLLSCLPGASTP